MFTALIGDTWRIRIQPSGARSLSLTWSNGETFELDYIELRFACPCAGCVDEMTGVQRLRRESISPDIRIKSITPVGHYAVRPTWSDGHDTGLIKFERLFDLCQSHGLQKLT